ncbi:MAG: N-acetyltransferase [Rhodospirillaceae bacterium]|nr:N-acetyltransferase [Rhodospirillaceae bacterium]
MSAIAIRPEQPGDRTAIHSLLVVAFAGSNEANLVDRLRADGGLTASLVATDGGRIVGQVAASPIAIEGVPGRTAASLAPLAVLPERQRQGIGAALMNALPKRLAAAGTDLVFVLGDPAYYTRFGFHVDAAGEFWSPLAGPAFMVRELLPGALDATRGSRLRYAPAFDPFLPPQ